MYAFVGLGNPDREHVNNRHNIGFMAIDHISDRYGLGQYVEKHKGLYQKASISGNNVHLLKPQTYMNRSGISVSSLVSFFKIPLENIFVFHDDLDLKPWVVKIKKGGGAGGHNGLRSIDSHIGKDYHRIRMGIGRPNDKNLVTPWVLGDFTSDDQGNIDNLCANISDNSNLLLDGNFDEFKKNI